MACINFLYTIFYSFLSQLYRTISNIKPFCHAGTQNRRFGFLKAALVTNTSQIGPRTKKCGCQMRTENSPDKWISSTLKGEELLFQIQSEMQNEISQKTARNVSS